MGSSFMLAGLAASVILLASGATLGAMAAPQPAPQPLDHGPLRVMSFNLRVRTPGDGANDWPNRRDLCASMIRFHQADIVAVQEAYTGMLQDLMQRLPGWHWVGQETSPGGAINAILWRQSRAAMVTHQTIWLGPPNAPGWDAAFARNATLARMSDTAGNAFTLVNTHWDHQGATARAESAVILGALAAGHDRVLVVGDFNCEPGNGPLEILARKGRLANARDTSLNRWHGPNLTFTGFSENLRGSEAVDHMFVRGTAVQQIGALADHFDGRLPSDHFPVLAEILLHP